MRSNDMIIFCGILIIFILYIIIGAGCWAYWDDEKGTLLEQAQLEHELLPMALMLTWPLFLWKWLRTDKNERQSWRRINMGERGP
jgi:hypothetical protein